MEVGSDCLSPLHLTAGWGSQWSEVFTSPKNTEGQTETGDPNCHLKLEKNHKLHWALLCLTCQKPSHHSTFAQGMVGRTAGMGGKAEGQVTQSARDFYPIKSGSVFRYRTSKHCLQLILIVSCTVTVTWSSPGIKSSLQCVCVAQTQTPHVSAPFHSP